MKTIRIESRSDFPLTAALRELVARLNDDDWVRCATDDGSSFYYIVGMKAHTEEKRAGLSHTSLSVGSGRPVSIVGEHQVHAQVASRRPGDYYLRQARNRLEASGIGSSQIDRFLDLFDKGDFQGAVGGWNFNQPGDWFDAFSNFLDALALRRGVDVDTLAPDVERKRELDIAIQKVNLAQLPRMFEGIVKRAGSLDPLTFDDAQLKEASRCYLYGFFRATILLSASAVEKCLKDAIGLTDLDHVEYGPLVAKAMEKGVLGRRERIGEEPACAVYSHEIFKQRNRVAHRSADPPSETAADEILTKARRVIEFVRGHR